MAWKPKSREARKTKRLGSGLVFEDAKVVHLTWNFACDFNGSGFCLLIVKQVVLVHSLSTSR